MTRMNIMVTGAAGFIGFHVSKALLDRGDSVCGVDNVNDYYSVSLKQDRLEILKEYPGFAPAVTDISDKARMETLFKEYRPDYVINLAAQAGVRHSLKHPHDYIRSNIQGFMNILEGCRYNGTRHLVFASSSSVYGSNRKLPFSVSDNVDHPISLYAATKKADELMAHSYSHLYNLSVTGLRFFSVYGPWGRPDMALYIFTDAINNGRPIDIYNCGKMRRSFTYIDDIVKGVLLTLNSIPEPDPEFSHMDPVPGSSSSPYRLYNIGNDKTVELKYLIELIEKGLGKEARKNMLPMQPGDIEESWADISALKRNTGFSPDTPIEQGVELFLEWYKEYHGT